MRLRDERASAKTCESVLDCDSITVLDTLKELTDVIRLAMRGNIS